VGIARLSGLTPAACIALDGVANVRDYVQGRALILSGKVVPPEQLADPSLPVKSFVG
jgi:hypothetical protein